jgi:inositol-pentakisphosphate 2-kinase
MLIPVFFHSDRDPPSLHALEPPPSSTTSPPSRCGLTYLNEGGANFVFRILHPSSTSTPPQLQGRLLRIRKALPHVQSAEAQLQALQDNFHSLFPEEHLVRHELISLDQSVLALLNTEIQAIERPAHRAQDFLPEEDLHALLMTDMTISEEGVENEVLLQLKPKWLAQSPNAPPNAKRCRTCALRACRAGKGVKTATDAQGSCPLALVDEDEAERKKAAEMLTDDEVIREYLVKDAQPLLQRLKSGQMIHDMSGVLALGVEEDEVADLCKAMTLRDCTLFVRRTGDAIEARLGDLDLKMPEKVGKWEEVECELIEGGWYGNEEREEVWVKEEICLLSRS